jgi:hypothetical protein
MITNQNPYDEEMRPTDLHQEQLRRKMRIIRTEAMGRCLAIEEYSRQLGIEIGGLGYRNIEQIMEEREFRH